MKAFVEQLRLVLQQPLPGAMAHAAMVPRGRSAGPFPEADFTFARKASVLLLLYEKNKQPHLVLTQRPEYQGTHGGQISLPGGQVEATDPSYWHTAIRETEEEIGVQQYLVEQLGALTPVYIPPSNFYVYPFIGYVNTQPLFIPDPKEVAGILEIALNELLSDSIAGSMQVNRNGLRFEVPAYLLEAGHVWGATALFLAELQFLLKQPSVSALVNRFG